MSFATYAPPRIWPDTGDCAGASQATQATVNTRNATLSKFQISMPHLNLNPTGAKDP